MKAILLSIKPKWTAKILNGEKTIEVRKTCPKEWKDYLSGKTNKVPEPMEVYMYVTQNNYLVLENEKDYECENHYIEQFVAIDKKRFTDKQIKVIYGKSYDGKVVGKFTLNKVDTIWWTPKEENPKDLFTKSCLSKNEIESYLNGNVGYAIHISNLEIFDKPKELGEFKVNKKVHKCDTCIFNPLCAGICAKETYSTIKTSLTKAPQNFCYIEVEE